MNHSLIEEAARRAGITLSEEQIFQVDRYVEHLKEENQKFNLTSIIEDEAIAIRHLEDSWHAASLFKRGSSLLDVGTGAGFPGLALKIVRPDLEVTLLDATGKKVTFLQDTIRLLDLHGVSALQGRAEELGRNPLYRERFDQVIARAVSALPELSELCLPLVKKGGFFIAMKGQDDEVKSAARAISLLGAVHEKTIRYELLGMDAPRSLVMIKKRSSTPRRFPRRMATIRQSPL